MLQKVLLIDDEAPARQLLREYLNKYEQLIIVGEANNGVDALRLIGELQPEIIFLDVQMPGLTGLEVMARLEEIPLVIFSTAYDRYALEAFDLHAVDYLLKPYTRERFARAIERLLTRLHQPQEGVRQLTQQLVDEQRPSDAPRKLLVSRGNRLVALDPEHILYIAADGDYCRVITTQGTFLSQYGIGPLTTRLPARDFMRIHRSTILNVHAVQEILRTGHTFTITLHNGDKVYVSRSYAKRFKQLMI